MEKESAILELYQVIRQDKLNSNEYTRILRKFNTHREELDKKLDKQCSEELENVLQLMQEMDTQETKEYFIEAFSLATRLMTEVYYKEDT